MSIVRRSSRSLLVIISLRFIRGVSLLKLALLKEIATERDASGGPS
jgi:hypothetical protein